jgi:glutamate 5-kinase
MGRGGMVSKYATATKLAKLGIQTTICNVLEENILHRVLCDETVGTTFTSFRKTLAHKNKRLLAFNPNISFAGDITVNKCLEDVLKNGLTAFSILPIGIINCTGGFKKGDVIEIKNEAGSIIGYGLAVFSSDELKPLIGTHHSKPFMRYEHIYIS